MSLKKYFKLYFIPHKGNHYRPRILRRSWLLFFLTITIASEGFLVANLLSQQTGTNFLAAVLPAEIISLTNTERQQNQVGGLTENAELTSAAQAKANDMAAKGYFSHVAPDGKTPWQWITESGYQYQYAGENLAVRFTESSDVVNAWMQSPTHRENMVKPVYTEIGVGVAKGMFQGSPATYVVQEFAAPVEASAVPVATTETPTESPLQAAPAKPVATPVASAPETSSNVAGASVAAASAVPPTSPGSFIQSFVRQLIRALSDPKLSNWILGLTAAVLIVALCMTFFVHLQIQPTNMLAGGVMVAALALAFLALNLNLSQGGVSMMQNQSAGLVESLPTNPVIDSGAAQVGYALFPQ